MNKKICGYKGCQKKATKKVSWTDEFNLPGDEPYIYSLFRCRIHQDEPPSGQNNPYEYRRLPDEND